LVKIVLVICCFFKNVFSSRCYRVCNFNWEPWLMETNIEHVWNLFLSSKQNNGSICGSNDEIGV
jgi:hypothetical protein